MDFSLIELVWNRANYCCEYCQLPQIYSVIPFEIDHIIARKHGGITSEENLALTCFYCNSYKGSNIAGIDPITSEVVQLFHPRRQQWKRHFQWQDSLLVGRTKSGRATIDVLKINNILARELREELIEEGVFPQ